MKNLLALVSLLLIVFNSFAFRVVGYFPTWKNFNATDIPYQKMTHVMISFVNPYNASGDLSSDNEAKFASIVSEAKKYNTKVFFSIGGAADNNNWANKPQLMAEATRGPFIQKLVDYCKKYNFDGIDVDIEGNNLGNPDYPYFLFDVIEAFHEEGKEVSAALAPNSYTAKVSKSEAEVFSYLDFLNIMSYDYAGPWSNEGQHSPFSRVQQGVDFFTSRGVKKENLVLGVPFYGYDFSKSGASMYTSYAQIVNNNTDAENKDKVNKIYYNGIPTIEKKTQYAIDNLDGIMIWELSQDATGEKSLLDAIYKLSEPVMSTNSTVTDQDMTYNNPVNDQLIIEASNNILAVNIYNLQGQLIRETNDNKIDMSSMSIGIYVVEVSTLVGVNRFKVIKQ